MAIKIKKATTDDLNDLAVLFDQYRVWYLQTSNIEGSKQFLSERIKNDESEIFLAYNDEQAAGFTQLYPIFSSVQMRRVYLLNDLYVTEDSRKIGVAQFLLDAAKQFAVKENAAFLILQTGNNNLGAQKLYEKSGWIKSSDLLYEIDL